MRLSLQIHDPNLGWLDCAEVDYHGNDDVSIEYEIEYGSRFLGRGDWYGLSVTFPVQLAPYRGPIPGYLVDLLPQGPELKKAMARYRIRGESDYGTMLLKIPFASPGNIRVREAWETTERDRPGYNGLGFSLEDIITRREDFVQYMYESGAPIGGTTGAAGGSPKFLVRRDANGRFHADGYLDDDLTSSSYLIKFPFSDSSNSHQLIRAEKAYYDVLRKLPLRTGAEISIHDHVLFIQRFDRIRSPNGPLYYYGLESLYSAHGINTFGESLNHEDNLALLHRLTSDPLTEIVEYLKRDLVNQALCNTDNHGRNTSLIKMDQTVALSPIYDVTAMKFYRGEHIIPLTSWGEERADDLVARVEWITSQFGYDRDEILGELRQLGEAMGDFESLQRECKVEPEIIERCHGDRQRCLQLLKEI